MEALADYQKSELIDGVVYDMSPANTKHIFIQGNLFNIIRNFLRGKRCKVMFEAEVRFDERNKFIPDMRPTTTFPRRSGRNSARKTEPRSVCR